MLTDQTWRFPSSSSSTVYVVQLRAADGRLSCDCMGWTRLRSTQKYRECKHTREIEQRLTTTGLTFATVGDARHALENGAEPAGLFEPPDVSDAETDVKDTIAYYDAQIALSAMETRVADALAAGATGTGVSHTGRTTSSPPELQEIPYHGPAVPAGYYSPMMAHSIPADKTISDYTDGEWGMQEKYDGVRVTLRVAGGTVKAWSSPRGQGVGKDRVLHPNITAALAAFPDGYYDGELVVPGGRSSDVAALENGERLCLFLFDMLEGAGLDLSDADDGHLGRRYDALVDAFMASGTDITRLNDGYVRLAPMYHPAQEIYDDLIERGGEGVMLKRLRSAYRPGHRSNDWLKVKAIFEDVFEIVGYEDGLSGPHSVALLERVSDRAPAKAKTLNNEMRRRCAAGELGPGTRVEVEHQGQMATGGFRHPMLKRVEGEE